MIALVIIIAVALLLCFAYYVSNDIVLAIADIDDRIGELEADIDRLTHDVNVVKDALMRREDDGK